MEIKGKVHYVGVNDRNKALFENLWPLPYGVSYNSYLIDDEMGRLSGIIARGGESADAKQEFSDCLQTIRAEQQKKQESAAELDDQAFRDLFRHHS